MAFHLLVWVRAMDGFLWFLIYLLTTLKSFMNYNTKDIEVFFFDVTYTILCFHRFETLSIHPLYICDGQRNQILQTWNQTKNAFKFVCNCIDRQIEK